MSFDATLLPPSLCLLLIRHAEADEARGAGREADEVRALTERGRRQAAALAVTLDALGYSPQALLTSPLVRARQTAVQLRDVAFKRAPIEVVDGLAIGRMRPALVLRAILAVADGVRPGAAHPAPNAGQRAQPAKVPHSSGEVEAPLTIALVGHEPDLGQLALDLLAPPHPDMTAPAHDEARPGLAIKKGGVVALTWKVDPRENPVPTIELCLAPRHTKRICKAVTGD